MGHKAIALLAALILLVTLIQTVRTLPAWQAYAAETDAGRVSMWFRTSAGFPGNIPDWERWCREQTALAVNR